jgi:Na+-driven multidrug efflux pump
MISLLLKCTPVATWAMMGVIWESFAAMTEGLGEAASVRVSFYLTEGLAKEARMLAHKVAFMSLILVLGVTSIFLMAGPNIAVTLSTDHTIQHLFTDLVGATGLANISMTYAQIYWSLAGAQGRFGFASAAILLCRWLVILPVASVCVFGHQFDLISVACTVSLGYAIAACILAYAVFSSDWEHLAFLFCEGVEAVDDVECYNDSGVILNEVDDEDDSQSSDDDEELEVLPEKLNLDNEKSQIDEETCEHNLL